MKKQSCDVLVVGGGPAGVGAATAAARLGAHVVLLERYGFLGGAATAGMAGTICGLYLRDTACAKPQLVASGFLKEFSGRLAKASSSRPMRLNDGLWVLPFGPGAFEAVADAMVSETGNVTLVLHGPLTEVRTEGACVVEARSLAWNEPLVFRPRVVVDCTGEATVTALAAGAVKDGSMDQAAAMVFAMENVAPGLFKPGMLEVWRKLRRGVEQGKLPAGCEWLSLVPGTGRKGRVVFKLNLPLGPKRGCPSRSGSTSGAVGKLSEHRPIIEAAAAEPAALRGIAGVRPAWREVTFLEREGRALAYQVCRFLVENVEAFECAHFSQVAMQLGVRSGRRICGLATLSEEAVLGSRKARDGIARGSWPIETWGDAPRPSLRFFAEGDYYEIPFSCLRPVGLDNLLAVGRCLSAAPGALASARVIGTALATGWAAGAAAGFGAAGKAMTEAIGFVRKQMAR